MPTKEDVKDAMDVLKAAGCLIETKIDATENKIVFVVYVYLNQMED